MKRIYDVRIAGWRPGLKTISLIDLVRGSARMSLTQAKDLVDSLLDGQSHTLSFETSEEARAFQAAADDLGVEVEFDPT